jgi:hypothetical protein
MHEVTSYGNIVIATAVVVIVLFMIMLVVVIDHKARLTEKKRDDIFHISGEKLGHPVWSYLIGAFILIIIFGVGVELVVSMLHYIPVSEKNKPSELLATLKQKKELEGERHFHNPANTLALEGKKSVCYYCHGDFPHFQKRMIRTLLNMHTQFIGCMTCHANPDKADENLITLKWLNFSGVEVKGGNFGVDYDKDTGYLVDTDDFFSKIVPYLNTDGTEQLLEITEDDPIAIDFVKVQSNLQGQNREAVKKSLHRMVRPKGRFCTRCHTEREKSFVPFEDLGFSEERIYDLTNLNIIGLVEKYKEFYMPNLMNREIEPIKLDTKSISAEK